MKFSLSMNSRRPLSESRPTAVLLGNLIAILAALASAGALADVHFREVFPPPPNVVDRPRIEILDEIRVGDSREVERLIPIATAKYRYPNGAQPVTGDPTVRPLVVLDSPGGNVMEAMKIGRALRKVRAWVMTLPGRPCASACVLILASGASRDVFGYDLGDESRGAVVAVGLHRPTLPSEQFAALRPEKAKTEYDHLTALVREYLNDMGMPDSLYQDMLRVPSQDIVWLNRKQLKDYALDGEDPAYAEYVRAKMFEHCGADYMAIEDALGRCISGRHSQKEIDNCLATFREAKSKIDTPCK